MTRLHADPLDVRLVDTGAGPEPAQFLWRGRLYVVREVLARWTESGRWWRTPAVQALTTGDAGPPVSAAGLAQLTVDDGERSWWRVEAGRASTTGVFDLCRDEAQGAWTLHRVLD